MYDVATIRDLYGLVGVRQPNNPTYAVIDENNRISRSGLYVTDNPLAKMELFIDNSDYAEATALQLNDVLKNIQVSSILDVMSEVFSDVDYIDNQMLYKNTMNFAAAETLGSGFVGYRIRKSSEKNVMFKINTVDLTFFNTGTLKLLLFNALTGKVEQSKEISITQRHQIETLNWTGKNQNAEYYIGYIKGSLIPYKRDYRFSNIKSTFTNLCIENIYVAGHTSESTIFNLDNVQGSSNSFGLNFNISEFYDYTDFIKTNEMLFARAVYLKFAINIIETYIGSIRSNKNERISKDMIFRAMAEVDGVESDESMIKKVGLKTLLFGELKSLKKKINVLKKGFFGGQIKVITLC